MLSFNLFPRNPFTLLIATALSGALLAPSLACDSCGCYLPAQQLITTEQTGRGIGFFGAASEQFTHFGTLQFNDREVANPSGQYLDSSITQAVVGATFFNDRFSLQVNVPLIYRSFRRPEGFRIDEGHESGLGDISFLANWRIFHREGLFSATGGDASKDGKTVHDATRGEPGLTMSFNLIAGVKLPTGDSSRIKEEFHEVDVPGAPVSGIHGHDLTLGTGSYDGIFGAEFFTRYRELFFEAETQFTLRGDSHYSYHFANELSWSGGPGVYLLRKARGSVGVQCVLSGETKNTDRFRGQVADDTGVNSLYIGPRVVAEVGRLSADIGADLPVVMNTTKLQAVPDYRIHAGLSWHF